MVNRPVDTLCTISGEGFSDALTFSPPLVAVPVANRATLDADPQSCVDVFHLHCHFTARTEAIAFELLESTKR